VIIRVEPPVRPVRPIGMSAAPRLFPASHTNRPRPATGRLRGALVAGAALSAGTCLLLAGCSGGSSATSGSAGSLHAAALAPESAPGAAAGVPGAGDPGAGDPGAPVQEPRLTALAPPAGQAIVYTASLTVRAADVRAAAAQAAQLASSAGGYVSSETARFSHRHPADGTISVQLKIPVASYQATLAALSARLGTRISLSQRAQDVTQTVADVTSRVASAQAAIVQLRRLLARAGSVSSLLMVQDQINAQEADLEALQSQQRALAHETTYGTVSVLLESRQPPPAGRPVKIAGGFAAGLATGWRALREVTSWLLTGVGALLPFLVFVIAAGYGAFRGWRWLARHRSGPRPAD
jgi:Domain of unknown function (DUF4349)